MNHKYSINSRNYGKFNNNNNNNNYIHSNIESKIYNKIENSKESKHKNSLTKFHKKKKNVINNSDRSWRESPEVEQEKIREIEEKIHEQRKKWEARKKPKKQNIESEAKEQPKMRILSSLLESGGWIPILGRRHKENQNQTVQKNRSIDVKKTKNIFENTKEKKKNVVIK